MVVSILLCGCTTWMFTKGMEKNIEENYTRMLNAILQKSWQKYPTKQQLYSHLTPISKNIHIKWTRHMWYFQKGKDEHKSDVLLWTLTHGCTSIGWPARIYLSQFYADIGCSLEDLLGSVNDRDWWRERESQGIWAVNMTWWLILK